MEYDPKSRTLFDARAPRPFDRDPRTFFCSLTGERPE